MSNLKQDILDVADGEEIEAIVIGGFLSFQNRHTNPDFDLIRGNLLSWQEAAPLLDYDHTYDECHAFTAWTKSKIIFISYDPGYGYTEAEVDFIPRNPIAYDPDMIGGYER